MQLGAVLRFRVRQAVVLSAFLTLTLVTVGPSPARGQIPPNCPPTAQPVPPGAMERSSGPASLFAAWSRLVARQNPGLVPSVRLAQLPIATSLAVCVIAASGPASVASLGGEATRAVIVVYPDASTEELFRFDGNRFGVSEPPGGPPTNNWDADLAVNTYSVIAPIPPGTMEPFFTVDRQGLEP